MPKMLKIEDRYKFPRGETVGAIRERTFDAQNFTASYFASYLNRNVYPYECVGGWFVIDAVKNGSLVIVTFGKQEKL